MYHHGNLRDALIDAGENVSRQSGPAVLNLRYLTQRVGVSPNAAYRHFSSRSDLVIAIAERVQNRMIRQLEQGLPHDRGRLRALYRRYLTFSLAEPQWYQVATMSRRDLGMPTAATAPPVLTVFPRLRATYLATPTPPREQITWPGWASLHGFASLTSDGALNSLSRLEIGRLMDQAVEIALHHTGDP